MKLKEYFFKLLEIVRFVMFKVIKTILPNDIVKTFVLLLITMLVMSDLRNFAIIRISIASICLWASSIIVSSNTTVQKAIRSNMLLKSQIGSMTHEEILSMIQSDVNGIIATQMPYQYLIDGNDKSLYEFEKVVLVEIYKLYSSGVLAELELLYSDTFLVDMVSYIYRFKVVNGDLRKYLVEK